MMQNALNTLVTDSYSMRQVQYLKVENQILSALTLYRQAATKKRPALPARRFSFTVLSPQLATFQKAQICSDLSAT